MTNKTGPRAAILAYLAKNGLSTLDDIMTGINESKRERVSSNLSAAIQDELIERKRDDVTNLPAYEITVKGKNWLTRNTGTATPPSAPKAAAVAVQRAADTVAPTDVTEQLRESRGNELALSQTIVEICCALGADPQQTSTTQLVALVSKLRAEAESNFSAKTSLEAIRTTEKLAMQDLRERLDQVTQQSLKDVDLLTEKNRRLHEELDALRSAPATAPTDVAKLDGRRPSLFVVIDSKGRVTRHKHCRTASSKAKRLVLKGAPHADIGAVWTIGRAKRSAKIVPEA